MKTGLRPIALFLLVTGLAALIGGNPEQALAAEASPVQPKDEIRNSGEWTYRVLITQPGTRSQGRLGELLHKGAALPVPGINDSVGTPWGKLYWHGRGIEDGLRLSEDQGWMQVPRPRRDPGREIVWPPEPSGQNQSYE